jgi:heptosyltransferase-2
MATPVFDCLRRNFAEAHISCVVRPYAKGIVKDGPWFDEIIPVDDKNWNGFWQLVRQVRRVRPEIAILLPNSTRSLLPFWLGGTARIYGYRRNLRTILLDGGPTPRREKGGRPAALPMGEYYMEICRWLGLEIPESLKPSLYIGTETAAKAQKLLLRYGVKEGQLVIGINPGASFGSSKCWPAEYFAGLAEVLQAEFAAKLILFSGPGEEQIAEAIITQSRATIIDTASDRVDLDLLKPLIKRCALLVTNDTGPRHYAVALDVPVVVIMGPTDPAYTSSNLNQTEVIRQQLPCSPCHRKVCPENHECMRSITPEMVLERCRTLMVRRNLRV